MFASGSHFTAFLLKLSPVLGTFRMPRYKERSTASVWFCKDIYFFSLIWNLRKLKHLRWGIVDDLKQYFLLTYILLNYYSLIYLLTYLLNYLLAHLLTYTLTFLLTYLLTYVLTCLRTYLLTYLLTYLIITHLFTYILTYTLTYVLIYLTLT